MKKKICFALDEFLFGGIERVAINLLKCIDYNKYDIDVIILSRHEDMIKQIPKECNIIMKKLDRYDCPLSRASTMIKRDAGAILYYGTYILKKIFIEPINYIRFSKISKVKYDVAIAFSGHLNDMYAVLKFIKSDKKIVWAHGMIYQYLLMSPAFEKMYSKFDKIVSINKLNQDDIFYCKPYLNYKIETLYNLSTKENPKANELECLNHVQRLGDYILSIARMDVPKDFITLIKAYKILTEKIGYNYNLVIVGDGPERKNIENFIDSFNDNEFKKHIYIEGSQSDVNKYYKYAKCFVLSSESEGLPMVIIEALSYNLPVISTDAPYGPRDILGNEYGILVPVKNEKVMAEKMELILKNLKEYKKYSIKSGERFKDFEASNIIKEFYKIIEE